MSLSLPSPSLNSSYACASLPTPSATQTHQSSNLKTACTTALSQGSGSPCTSCRLTVTLNAKSICNSCSAIKKARVREGKKKRKSLHASSATRKSLAMVSADAGGIATNAVEVASSQTQISKPSGSGHVNKKPKLSSSSSITPINSVYQTDKDLYSHLRHTKARHRRQFSGTYSIIADPKIHTSERIDSVFKALEDRAGVPCSMRIGYFTGAMGYGGQYLCSCTTACAGTISVLVDDDNTHPLFSGQKITVEIKH